MYCNKYAYLIAICFLKKSVKQFKKDEGHPLKNCSGIWQMVMQWLCCTDAPAAGRGLRQPALPRSFTLPLGHMHFHHSSLVKLFLQELPSLMWVESRLQAKGCLKMKTCCWIKGKMKTLQADSHRGLICYILRETDAIYGTSGGCPEPVYSGRHVDSHKTKQNQKCLL